VGSVTIVETGVPGVIDAVLLLLSQLTAMVFVITGVTATGALMLPTEVIVASWELLSGVGGGVVR